MTPDPLRSDPDPHPGVDIDGDAASDMAGSDEPNRLAGLPLFACVPDPAPAPAVPTAATTPPTSPRLKAVRAGKAPDGLARGLAHPPEAVAERLAHQREASGPGLARTLHPAQLRPATTSPIDHAEGSTTAPAMDWAQVRAFRQQAAELLTTQLRERGGLDEQARREIGRALIVAMLRDHADTLLTKGGQPPTPAQEHAMAGAIFDALFNMGRLQPLVDLPDVENIEITGCDPVYLDYGDGLGEIVPAVADSDEELIESLAFLAARSGGDTGSGERAFSPAAPILDLTLPGGMRLAARAWISPRPLVVIRRHRFTDVDIEDLRQLAMLDGAAAALLSAAMRANKTIVISGAQGAGKTTLARALCNELDPWERIGTIETEYELLLHTLPERHRRIVALEARPGTGERTPDGRAAGEITLDDLLYSALRLNLSRIVVGEVRGQEILPLIKSAQAGAGTLSTTHAHSARAAIERLVTCALEAGPHITQEYAYLQIASHIDLIVQIGVDDQTHHGGRKHRFVSEIIEVGRGEGGRPAVTDVFAPGPDGRAVPRTRPSFLADLERAGFDPAWLDQPEGTW